MEDSIVRRDGSLGGDNESSDDFTVAQAVDEVDDPWKTKARKKSEV